MDLGKTFVTSSITLTILDVYPGTKYKDTAFSDIHFLYAEHGAKPTAEGPPQDEVKYLMPETSQRLITEAEFAGKSARELRLIRNKIYARHGRPFVTDWIREYFRSQVWCREDPNFTNDCLSEIEWKNVLLIRSYERKMGYK